MDCQTSRKAFSTKGPLVSVAAPLGAIFGWAFFSFWSAIPAAMALVGAPLRERIQRRTSRSGKK